jgi:hypothetical protein
LAEIARARAVIEARAKERHAREPGLSGSLCETIFGD